MFRFLAAFAWVIPVNFASAEVPLPKVFHCDIKQVYEVSSEGLIEPSEKFWQDTHSRDQLVIDREQGRVLHPYFGTTNYQESLYIDPGSNEWGFKMFAYSMALQPDPIEDRNAVATFVQVFTYIEGPMKPFIAMESSNFVTGLCQ
jgi:hypothetical protein